MTCVAERVVRLCDGGRVDPRRARNQQKSRLQFPHPVSSTEPADKAFPKPTIIKPAEKTLLKNPVMNNPDVAKKSEKQVPIDRVTSIPEKLYWTMLRTGERLENEGQHQLVVRRGKEPKLVLMRAKSSPLGAC